MANESFLNIDVRKVLEQIEAKYNLKLPRKVITIDYGEDLGDLYMCFKHADHTEGEPSADGKITLHYLEGKLPLQKSQIGGSVPLSMSVLSMWEPFGGCCF